MTKILFVCLGNICRSTMAECVMKELVRRAGREGEFEIDSAGTSTYEVGNPMHHGTRSKLRAVGIPTGNHIARQMTKRDYKHFDLIIGMDQSNMQNMLRMTGGDPQGKLHLLLDYTDRPGAIADPWYTGDFEATYRDVLEGCEGLLKQLGGEE
ncbi:MAG: low molecular weight phosphotyrosine protein phosphatase [Firmicutes bacterium]|nr:low molecular weight phosphotyrosine protein phosphatase [Bacillota bacterium]